MPSPRLPTPLLAIRRPSAFPSFPPSLPHRNWHSSPPTSSHVGSAPIPLPTTVSFLPPSSSPSVTSSSTFARVRGPKGELTVDIAPFVRLAVAPRAAVVDEANSDAVKGAELTVAVADASLKQQRAVWGLTRSLLANAVKGVSEGYTLSLRLVGVGYRAAVEAVPSISEEPSSSQRLNLKLGFAHPVLIDLPSDVQATTPLPTSIVLHGIDKQRLGQVAARIRSWRIPEPYNVRFPSLPFTPHIR
jgi:large subunit ribosomal protein L6